MIWLIGLEILFCAASVYLVKYRYRQWKWDEFYELYSPGWMPEYCEPCAVFWTFIAFQIPIMIYVLWLN